MNLKNKITDDKLIEALEKESWGDVYKAEDVDEAMLAFYSILNKRIAEAEVPCKVRSKFKPIKPWITVGLVTSIRKRDKLSKKCLKHPNNTKIKEYYLLYRRKLGFLLKKARVEYFKEKIQECQGCPKKFRNIIKNISGKTNVKSSYLKTFLTDQSLTANAALNNLNHFFCSVEKDLAKALEDDRRPTPASATWADLGLFR